MSERDQSPEGRLVEAVRAELAQHGSPGAGGAYELEIGPVFDEPGSCDDCESDRSRAQSA